MLGRLYQQNLCSFQRNSFERTINAFILSAEWYRNRQTKGNNMMEDKYILRTDQILFTSYWNFGFEINYVHDVCGPFKTRK